MHVRSYAQIEPFITLDGSEIREWAGRIAAPAQNQSLAEATIPVGGATTEHYHRLSEELYLVSAGQGRLVIDGEERIISEGDCALIAPDGTRIYQNRTALVLRTRWGKIVEQNDFYVDTAPIAELDRKLTELGIQAIPKPS
jgi:mannose-6-phosphate isomerase-like protein (cupin superfamily)